METEDTVAAAAATTTEGAEPEVDALLTRAHFEEAM
eukprot:ctg_5366.g600